MDHELCGWNRLSPSHSVVEKALGRVYIFTVHSHTMLIERNHHYKSHVSYPWQITGVVLDYTYLHLLIGCLFKQICPW